MSKWKMVPVEPTDEMIHAIDGLICSSYLWPVYAYRAMIDAAPVQHGEAMAPDNPMTTPGIIWRSDDLTTPIEGWRGTLEIRAGSAVDSATGPLAELARLRAENERLTGALQEIADTPATPDNHDLVAVIMLAQHALQADAPTAPPAR